MFDLFWCRKDRWIQKMGFKIWKHDGINLEFGPIWGRFQICLRYPQKNMLKYGFGAFLCKMAWRFRKIYSGQWEMTGKGCFGLFLLKWLILGKSEGFEIWGRLQHQCHRNIRLLLGKTNFIGKISKFGWLWLIFRDFLQKWLI